MSTSLTYSGAGVNYKDLDPFKVLAQRAASKTARHLERFGFREVPESRGESVYLIETPDCFLAHVEEGLGTKNLVADTIYSRDPNRSYYEALAQDTVAMIVNDMATAGATPLSVAMHLALGDDDWIKNQLRTEELVLGWAKACSLARCAWGGGETPMLKGIVTPGTVVLNGSALGIIKPKERRIRGNVRDGDVIVLLKSSGIHANGLSLARRIARDLPEGYDARVDELSAATYGEVLLAPTIIYVPVIEDCLNEGVEIHYAVNITGHGWRKLMRLDEPFVYVIERIPMPQPVFTFMQRAGPVDDKEAYATFNMGAGLALYVPETEIGKITRIASKHNIFAFMAGHIEKRGGEKKVVIEPKGITYEESSLGFR